MQANYKTDPELGLKIHQSLRESDLEGPYERVDWEVDEAQVLRNVEEVLAELGLNLYHPSTNRTGERFTSVLINDMTWGMNYNNFPHAATFPTQNYDELVIVKDIKVHSVCEHHFVPIIGTAHIGYIPASLALGLSKFNRIVDFFSRRPQQQERLTMQICHALEFILATRDVAVVINAEHFCTRYRGIEDPCSSTITSCMHDRFRDKPELRQEFLDLLNLGSTHR